LFEELIEYSNYDYTSDSTVIRAKEIVDSLVKSGYSSFKSDYYTKLINGELHIITSRTYLFGKICEKNVGSTGVNLFMNYMLDHSGSAEEELSFSFERIFRTHPREILKRINSSDEKSQKYFLDQIVWGFVNNRLYGIKDPDTDISSSAFIITEPAPECKLKVSTYKNMFFSLNNELLQLKKEYPEEITYLLNQIEGILNWDEEHNQQKRN